MARPETIEIPEVFFLTGATGASRGVGRAAWAGAIATWSLIWEMSAMI
jgi:hypothetical protein